MCLEYTIITVVIVMSSITYMRRLKRNGGGGSRTQGKRKRERKGEKREGERERERTRGRARERERDGREEIYSLNGFMIHGFLPFLSSSFSLPAYAIGRPGYRGISIVSNCLRLLPSSPLHLTLAILYTLLKPFRS